MKTPSRVASRTAPGHGVRDVVVLEVEEDAEAALERALDGQRGRPR